MVAIPDAFSDNKLKRNFIYENAGTRPALRREQSKKLLSYNVNNQFSEHFAVNLLPEILFLSRMVAIPDAFSDNKLKRNFIYEICHGYR
jgi:hypothetical protein